MLTCADGLVHRLIKEKGMELVEKGRLPSGDYLYDFECSDDEATALFIAGLQDLVGESHKVLPADKAERALPSGTKTVEIGDELWQHCINVAVVNALTEELKRGEDNGIST